METLKKLKYMEESDLGGNRPASTEDFKKWYMEECDKSLKLQEEIRLRDFRKIEGRDTRKIVVLNLLETHIIV